MTPSEAQAPDTLSVHVSRLVRAPREVVFDAWIKPQIRRQWWLTGREEGLKTCDIDARVGGRYCLSQIGGGEKSTVAEDYEWIMTGEFLEVDRPQRLVFTWNVNHPDEPANEERVTIDFNEVADGTEVVITHEGILSGKLRDGTEHGWTTLVKSLAKVLEES